MDKNCSGQICVEENQIERNSQINKIPVSNKTSQNENKISSKIPNQIRKINEKLSKKVGISLIALVITIIIIIILAAIVMMSSVNTVDSASYAKFAHEISEIQTSTDARRAKNAINGPGEENHNKGFTKVAIDNPPDSFVSFDEDAITGYWVDLDFIEIKDIKTGREELTGNKVTFGKEDVYVYDYEGKVYYAKGYPDDNGRIHYKVDETAPSTGIPPTISKIEYEISADKQSAIVTVVAEAINGGALTVTGGGKTASKIGENTYQLVISQNGTIVVSVKESDGGRTTQSITISGIEVKVEYTISYNANGGSRAPSSHTVKEGEITQISNSKPNREGYEFKGWATSQTNANNGNVAYSGGESYVGNGNLTLFAVWEIVTVEVSSLSISSVENQTYTGSAIEPKPTVKYGTKTLTLNTHYTLSYSNNTNVGTASITVTGKGSYVGSQTITFEIVKANMNGIKVTEYEAEYDGEGRGIEVELTGTSQGATVKYGTTSGSYTQTVSPRYTEVGTYTIYFEVTKDNYNTETGSATVKITAITMDTSGSIEASKRITISSVANQEYTGREIRPEPTVKYGSKTLTKDTDYTFGYSNNTNVGTATITVTGKGNYAGTVSTTFEIINVTMTGISSEGFDGEYDGNAHGITVSLSGTSAGGSVKYGTSRGSYTQTTSPTYTEAGTYTVYYQVSKTNYESVEGEETVRITKRTMSDSESVDASKRITVSEIADQTYTGTAITPEPTVKYGNKTLTLNKDYTLGYANNTNVGIATITVTGKGNYLGTVETTFNITNATIIGSTSAGYTGTYDGQSYGITVTPGTTVTTATVKYGTVQGEYISDTTPIFKNAGTYTVYYKIEAANYTTVYGSETVTINKKSVTVAWSNLELEYTGSNLRPTATATGITGETINLTVTTDAVNVGTYQATAVIDTVTNGSKDNYTLTDTTTNFTIKAIPLDGSVETVTVKLGETSYEYTGTEITPSVVVTVGEDTLVEGTDYIVACTENVNVGTATVTITGLNNYTGEILQTFEITKADANKITLSSTEISFKYKGETQIVEVTRDGDGDINAFSMDTSIVTVNVEDNKIEITPLKDGNTTIIVSVLEGTNYKAPEDEVIKIDVGIEEITLTASKDMNPLIEGNKNVETVGSNVFSNVKEEQTFYITNVKTYNVVLNTKNYIESNLDMCGNDANKTFAITISMNDGEEKDILSDVNHLELGKVNINSCPNLTYKIYNANALSDISQEQYIIVELTSDKGLIIEQKININKELAEASEIQTEVIAGKQFVTFDNNITSVDISQDSAFTAQFCVELIPDLYKEHQIIFSDILPTGTNITLTHITDIEKPTYWYYKVNEEISSVYLEEFTEMGKTQNSNYIKNTGNDIIDNVFLVTVDFSQCDEEKLLLGDYTIKMLINGIGVKNITSSELEFVTKNRSIYSLQSVESVLVGEEFIVNYSVEQSLGMESKYENRERTLVITTPNNFPNDAELIVDNNIYYLNSNKQFIVPIENIQNNNDDVKMQIDFNSFSAEGTEYNIDIALWISATSNGEAPLLGEKIESISVLVKEKLRPSLMVSGTGSRMFSQGETINVNYEYIPVDDSWITIELQNKDENMTYQKVTDKLISVNGSSENTSGVFEVIANQGTNEITIILSDDIESGTYRFVFKVYDYLNRQLLEIPYNILIS